MPYEDGRDRLECLQINYDGRQVFDLRTGQVSSSKVDKVCDILPFNLEVIPYPGDVSDENASWIVDSLIQLDKIYPSEFFFLNFAGTLLIANYEIDPDRSKFHRQINYTFEQINRFRNYYKKKRGKDLKVLVISTGRTTAFEGYVDIVKASKRFNNFAFLPFENYMGVFFNKEFKRFFVSGDEPVLKDGSRSPKPRSEFSREESEALNFLSEIEGIEKVIVTSELLEKIGDYSSEYITGSPDLLVKVAKGKIFLVSHVSARKLYYIPDSTIKNVGFSLLGDWDNSIPLKSLTDVFLSTKYNLNQGPTMLAVIEGANSTEIPNCRGIIDVTVDEINYLFGYHFLVTLNTGIPLTRSLIPYGANLDFIKTNKYPYSWGLPPITAGLGSDKFNDMRPCRSIAIGSRSIFMHTTTNCDISLEPWVRNRTENGSFYVLNRDQIEHKNEMDK